MALPLRLPRPGGNLSVAVFALCLPLIAIAQDTLGTLPSGALRQPEDQGLPWTYIGLILILLAGFLLLRRSGSTLPSKRRNRG